MRKLKKELRNLIFWSISNDTFYCIPTNFHGCLTKKKFILPNQFFQYCFFVACDGDFVLLPINLKPTDFSCLLQCNRPNNAFLFFYNFLNNFSKYIHIIFLS